LSGSLAFDDLLKNLSNIFISEYNINNDRAKKDIFALIRDFRADPIDRIYPNPAIYPTNIISNLIPIPLNGRNEMKILTAVHLAQNDISPLQLPTPYRFDCHQLT
jgi:hypothetical protein